MRLCFAYLMADAHLNLERDKSRRGCLMLCHKLQKICRFLDTDGVISKQFGASCTEPVAVNYFVWLYENVGIQSNMTQT